MKNENATLLTTGEVARKLERSTTCVIKYEKQGRITAYRSECGYRYFFAKDVERLRRELTNDQ